LINFRVHMTWFGAFSAFPIAWNGGELKDGAKNEKLKHQNKTNHETFKIK
jgi:hypothetical protein